MRTGSLVVVKPDAVKVAIGVVTTDGELIAVDGIAELLADCKATGQPTDIRLRAITDYATQQKASDLYILHQCEVAQSQ